MPDLMHRLRAVPDWLEQRFGKTCTNEWPDHTPAPGLCNHHTCATRGRHDYHHCTNCTRTWTNTTNPFTAAWKKDARG
jgi:hypothetical protein